MANGFFLDSQEEALKGELTKALYDHNYLAFYAGLRKLEKPLGLITAVDIAAVLIERRCTVRSFRALLDHVESREELIHFRYKTHDGRETRGLLPTAAHYNTGILDLLLNLGASPKRLLEDELSPLEGAFFGKNLASVRRLLKEPELDLDLTPTLRRLWVQAEDDPELRACWRLAAPLVAGIEMPPFGPVPVLKELTPMDAAVYENWDLVRRICRTQGHMSVDDAAYILEEFANQYTNKEPVSLEELGSMLECLLPLCPRVLRRRRPQQLLLLYCLEREEPSPVLMGWLNRMPRRVIYLWDEDSGLTSRQWYGEDGLLARWRERVGGRLVPALDRNEWLPYNEAFPGTFTWEKAPPAEYEALLRTCMVRGRCKPGELSRLAKDVLRRCSPAAIIEQLAPGGFLTREDPALLMEFAKDKNCRLEVGQTLAAYLKWGEADPYRL